MSVKVHEPVCEDSAQDLYFWFDHFLGDQMKDEWAAAGAGGATAVIDAQTGGIVRNTTGATTGNNRFIYWADIRSLLVSKKATMETRVKLNQAVLLRADIALRFDFNNQLRFTFDEVASGAINWSINARDGGAGTTGDSGIAVDALNHIFRIECHTHTANHAHFYIDGVECANSPLTTNIPDDAIDYLQPYLYLDTNEDAAKSKDIDYVVVRQER